MTSRTGLVQLLEISNLLALFERLDTWLSVKLNGVEIISGGNIIRTQRKLVILLTRMAPNNWLNWQIKCAVYSLMDGRSVINILSVWEIYLKHKPPSHRYSSLNPKNLHIFHGFHWRIAAGFSREWTFIVWVVGAPSCYWRWEIMSLMWGRAFMNNNYGRSWGGLRRERI